MGASLGKFWSLDLDALVKEMVYGAPEMKSRMISSSRTQSRELHLATA